ncbi:hypothetical protein IWT5_00685 [Secundilactobacillus silagincola]|uniref:Uncharacterized protein n=1 Tax=Secundilactobacillus silagincola TaxID=1714681 RepID=A0A1Z5H5F4_9LACO|nr:hypothetical protein [Secundilactobacillus silagincola]GAT18411.1 hypothetical protein IWT5_00685 [Secundilactobacillus silagincola]
MTVLTIAGKTYPDLQIPDDYQVVVNQLVPRDDEQVHLLRYQPADLPEEALGREHVTVIYRDDGGLYSYNALTEPLSGPLPTEQEAWNKAEKIWQQVAPDYRNKLERLRILEGQERHYTDATGKTVTFPILWAKYANTVDLGSYEWIGLGPNNRLVEFERYNFWDYEAGRQKTEMWYGDDWIRARRGLPPQMEAPWPRA